MSGPQETPEKSVQDFLQRWSRRKLGVADTSNAPEAADGTAPAPAQPSLAGEPKPPDIPQAAPALPAFDLASLPSIESIDATTDIRAFLAPGVPSELTRAALRRAWTSDPSIRDFVGLAENQWDFTNPEAVPGFGTLEFTEEVRAMVSRLFGETPVETPQASGETGEAHRSEPALLNPAEHDGGALNAPPAVSRDDDAGARVAVQNKSCPESAPAQPKHGGALPK